MISCTLQTRLTRARGRHTFPLCFALLLISSLTVPFQSSLAQDAVNCFRQRNDPQARCLPAPQTGCGIDAASAGLGYLCGYPRAIAPSSTTLGAPGSTSVGDQYNHLLSTYYTILSEQGSRHEGTENSYPLLNAYSTLFRKYNLDRVLEETLQGDLRSACALLPGFVDTLLPPSSATKPLTKAPSKVELRTNGASTKATAQSRGIQGK